jgi:hypothetical protein
MRYYHAQRDAVETVIWLHDRRAFRTGQRPCLTTQKSVFNRLGAKPQRQVSLLIIKRTDECHESHPIEPKASKALQSPYKLQRFAGLLRRTAGPQQRRANPGHQARAR